jgi:hypothetical protein
MEVLKRSEPFIKNYQCSLCRLYFKSLGEMQKHMLKSHMLKLDNLQVSQS